MSPDVENTNGSQASYFCLLLCNMEFLGEIDPDIAVL